MNKKLIYGAFANFVFLILFWTPASAALFNQACSPVAGCTANDIGVQDVQIVFVDDGCVGPNDTARVKMDMNVTSAGPNRYDIGIFVNTAGEPYANSIDGGTECLHEALFEVGTPVDRGSGLGLFVSLDTDSCGDLNSNDWAKRTVSDSDIGGTNQPAIFTIGCMDSDNNGYVDFAWQVSYVQNAGGVNCQSVTDAVAGAKSKCQEGISDTFGTIGSIPIGVPDLNVTISCTPSGIKAGETTTCTVDYTNNSALGAADYIEWHLDYNQTYGTVGNITITSDGGSVTDTATDTGSYINWVVDPNSTTGYPRYANIQPSQAGQVTFEYTLSPTFDDFAGDFRKPQVNPILKKERDLC